MAVKRPIGDTVLLKQIKEDGEQMSGGILVPMTAQDGTAIYEIIEFGTAYEGDGLEVGSRVLIHAEDTVKVMLDGAECIAVPTENVIAKVDS